MSCVVSAGGFRTDEAIEVTFEKLSGARRGFCARETKSGELLFTIRWERSSEWSLLDSQETRLLCLRKRRAKLHGGWVAYDPAAESSKMFTVKRASVLSHSSLRVFLGSNAQEKSPDFAVEESDYRKYGPGKTIAQLFAFMEDKQQLQIVGGVDLAFVVALVFIWHKLHATLSEAGHASIKQAGAHNVP